MKKVRQWVVLSGNMSWQGKSTRECSKVRNIICTLIWVHVTQLCTCTKTHWIVHLRLFVSLNVNYTSVKILEKQCCASFLGDTTFHYDQWNITLRKNLSSKYSLKMPPNNSAGPCTSCTSFLQAGDLRSPPLESDLGLELLCPGERREVTIGVSERRNEWAPAPFPPYLWDSAAMLQWNVWVKRGFPWPRMKACAALLSSHVTAGGRLRRGPPEWVSPASSVARRGDRSCPWSRPRSQNHKQINSYCFKLLNLGAVCYTALDS